MTSLFYMFTIKEVHLSKLAKDLEFAYKARNGLSDDGMKENSQK